MKKIIAVDFDGTLCEHVYPEIGEPKKEVLDWIYEQQRQGAKIILWTCREGFELKKAIDWCRDQGLIFDAINENIPELKNREFGIRKPYADIYLDDRAMDLSMFQAKAMNE